MSKLKTNTIRHVDGSNDNITLDSSQNVTVEGVLKTDSLRHTGASSDAVTLATDGTCTAKITNNLSNRNLIINGAMQVAQRYTSITAEGYPADRFLVQYANLDEAPTLSQHALTSSDTGPWEKGFRYSSHIQNGNQNSGDSIDYMIITTTLEAQDMASSGWNYTSASSYVTLSYWVKSSVEQNFYHYVRTADGTGQLYAWETGTLSANTWTKITKKIPGNSNIQFDNDSGLGLTLTIPMFWGANWTNNNSLNTWAAFDTNNRVPDNPTAWFTTNDATFEITGVQLEVGDVATDFEHRSYGDELARCQRYYYKLPIEGSNGPPAYQYYPTNKQSVIFFPTEMRDTPTCTATWSTAGTFTQYHNSRSHFKAYVNSDYDTNNSYYITLLTADAEL